MGLLTPFLPCGPLYLVFAAALLAGSAAKGAEFTLAFGLGTVPLLWLAQHQFHRIRAKLTPLAMARLRRGLALVTALMLVWRLHGTVPAHASTAPRPNRPRPPPRNSRRAAIESLAQPVPTLIRCPQNVAAVYDRRTLP